MLEQYSDGFSGVWEESVEACRYQWQLVVTLIDVKVHVEADVVDCLKMLAMEFMQGRSRPLH